MGSRSRRPIFAGLPLFVLYLVPAAVLPHGVPWPLFALAGAGWILIQLVDGRERLAHWGRVVGASGKVTADATALGGTGRRLGATALMDVSDGLLADLGIEQQTARLRASLAEEVVEFIDRKSVV